MKRERTTASPVAEPAARAGLQPWHLLLVGVLAVTAAAVVATRGTSTANVVGVGAAALTAGLVAAAAYHTLMPLAGTDDDEQSDMLGGRTRAALEREKMLVLRSIKEIEFDHAMRKISAADYQEMLGRLRARAAGLIRQLDGHAGYRPLIERDLAAVVGRPATPAAAAGARPIGACAACGVAHDPDARFCKACGARIGEAS